MTLQQVIDAIRNGRESKCIDSRDYARLSPYFSTDDLSLIGFETKNPDRTPLEWTKENILDQLRRDVAFGFEKALDRRGLSAGSMYEVILMWMWVLEDELQHFDDYTYYGLPLFKAVAVKYGFDNEIGDDTGSEDKYKS